MLCCSQYSSLISDKKIEQVSNRQTRSAASNIRSASCFSPASFTDSMHLGTGAPGPPVGWSHQLVGATSWLEYRHWTNDHRNQCVFSPRSGRTNSVETSA